jgi:hypothetical protein
MRCHQFLGLLLPQSFKVATSQCEHRQTKRQCKVRRKVWNVCSDSQNVSLSSWGIAVGAPASIRTQPDRYRYPSVRFLLVHTTAGCILIYNAAFSVHVPFPHLNFTKWRWKGSRALKRDVSCVAWKWLSLKWPAFMTNETVITRSSSDRL